MTAACGGNTALAILLTIASNVLGNGCFLRKGAMRLKGLILPFPFLLLQGRESLTSVQKMPAGNFNSNSDQFYV